MFRRELFGTAPVAARDGGGESRLAETPAFYGVREEERISRLVDLTQKVFLAVDRELRLTGFRDSIPSRPGTG